MSANLYTDLNQLTKRVQSVKAVLLREVLERQNLRGLERLDLTALVTEVGVKGAARRARYFSAVLRASTRPAVIELLLAVWERHTTVARYRKNGWLRTA